MRSSLFNWTDTSHSPSPREPSRWWRSKMFGWCAQSESSKMNIHILTTNWIIVIQLYRHFTLSISARTESVLKERNIWLMRSKWMKSEENSHFHISCDHRYSTEQTLHTLHLRENQVGDEGARCLADTLNLNRVGWPLTFPYLMRSSLFNWTDTSHSWSQQEPSRRSRDELFGWCSQTESSEMNTHILTSHLITVIQPNRHFTPSIYQKIKPDLKER